MSEGAEQNVSGQGGSWHAVRRRRSARITQAACTHGEEKQKEIGDEREEKRRQDSSRSLSVLTLRGRAVMLSELETCLCLLVYLVV